MKEVLDYQNMAKKVANMLTADNPQDFEDYFQTGMIGVINAFDRECPENVDFDYFVFMHIKSAIWSYKLNDSVIPIKGSKLERVSMIDTMTSLDFENGSYDETIEEDVERISLHVEDEISRNMLVMRFKYELELKDIGAAYGVTYEAARLRINKAIEELKCTA